MTHECPVDIHKMQLADSIEGDSIVDTNLLREMAAEAHAFIGEREWCERVERQYLAFGVGGVVAVFLFYITPRFEDVDRYLWAIIGDLPPAYLVVEDNLTAADALEAYCSEMNVWVEAVRKGEGVEELIPVSAPPTRDYAEQLNGRLEFLRSEIIPLAAGGFPRS